MKILRNFIWDAVTSFVMIYYAITVDGTFQILAMIGLAIIIAFACVDDRPKKGV